MLKYRLLLGPVLVLGLVATLWLDEVLQDRTQGRFGLDGGIPGIAMLPVMAVAVVFASQEIAPIFRALDTRASKRVLTAAALLGLFTSALTPDTIATFSGVAITCTSATAVLIGAMLIYSRTRSAEGVVAATAAALTAFVYLGLMFGFLFVLRKQFTAWHVLAILAITKSYDIGAYFTGRAIGKHKLIPWLSPGKTWEGLAGGLATATLIAVAADAIAAPLHVPATPTLAQAAVLGLILGLVGQAGDLVASIFKRDAGVKDYAATLPGFGGVMDVIDSPLLVAPVAYWLLTLYTTNP